MTKQVLYHAIIIIVILLLFNLRYAAIYQDLDASYGWHLADKHEKIISDISAIIEKRKTIDIKFSDFPYDDYRNLERNWIINHYDVLIPVVPGLLFIKRERIVETKFYIDKEGFIIVYSYFLYQMKNNVFVSISYGSALGNALRDKPTNLMYIQNYMTESKLINLLNEKGLSVNNLCLDVPVDEIRGIPKKWQNPILLKLTSVVFILGSFIISSVLIYKKKEYKHSILLYLVILPIFFFTDGYGYDLLLYLMWSFILSFIVLAVLIMRGKSGTENVKASFTEKQ